MIKVYMQIQGQVFECLPSQTEISTNREWQTIDNCNVPNGTWMSGFVAAITTEQPWSCRMQRVWNKAMKKKRMVKLVMVTDDSAEEFILQNVRINYLDNIDDGSGKTRPLIPVIKGETTEMKTIHHTHAWWQV